MLAACSNYFQSLFMENTCKHPIVFLKVKFINIEINPDVGEISIQINPNVFLKVKFINIQINPNVGEITIQINPNVGEVSIQISPNVFLKVKMYNVKNSGGEV